MNTSKQTNHRLLVCCQWPLCQRTNLSSNHFGDLIKKKTAQEYIQSNLIDVAKERVFDQSKSVSEIAYELGFKYPQHFTRLFKQRVTNIIDEDCYVIAEWYKERWEIETFF